MKVQIRMVTLTRTTLQVANILLAIVPKILELVAWFVKTLLKPKELVAKWQLSKNSNLEGCRMVKDTCGGRGCTYPRNLKKSFITPLPYCYRSIIVIMWDKTHLVFEKTKHSRQFVSRVNRLHAVVLWGTCMWQLNLQLLSKGLCMQVN